MQCYHKSVSGLQSLHVSVAAQKSDPSKGAGNLLLYSCTLFSEPSKTGELQGICCWESLMQFSRAALARTEDIACTLSTPLTGLQNMPAQCEHLLRDQGTVLRITGLGASLRYQMQSR
jgi:hypothetical protein